MNDSVAFAVASLVPRTVMYPIDNIAIYQQAKSETFVNAVRGCSSRLFAGYRYYSTRTFISQSVRWELFGRLNEKHGVVPASLMAASVSSIIVQPLEVMRQNIVTDFKINRSKSLFSGSVRAAIYSNAYSLVELNTYNHLRRREINPYLVGPIVFFTIKVFCHPIETMMRIKIIDGSIKLRYLYNGFCIATTKSIAGGFVQYSLYHVLRSH